MALHELGKDPDSKNGGSPTLYFDDERGSYLMQGWKVLDASRREQMDIPEHEDVVEFPASMVQFFPEVNGGVGDGV